VMVCWILTFNRPRALNRQIEVFGKDGCDVHVMSNHPLVQIDKHLRPYVHKVVVNTLGDAESTAYTTRSWNAMFLKTFKQHDEAIFVQDDTLITQEALEIVRTQTHQFDLIWGPAGDQFWYMKKLILRQVGFFDERFSTGAFCGDADFLKRVWFQCDQSRLSIVEKHDFGFMHQDIGLSHLIPTDVGHKAIDSTYINQHQECQQKSGNDLWMQYAQELFLNKWGHRLNGTGPLTDHPSPPRWTELFLYPWFTKKYLGYDGLPPWCLPYERTA